MQYDLKYAYFNFLQSIHYNSVTEAAQAESCSDDENKDVRKWMMVFIFHKGIKQQRRRVLIKQLIVVPSHSSHELVCHR